MSRRKRHRSGSRAGGSWAVRLAVVFLVLALGGGAVGYGLIRSYLHSDAFRLLLSDNVSKALEVEGAFAPLRWDGLAARTGRFEGAGDGPLLAIRADDVRTEIGLDGFRDGYWLLKDSAVRNLEVTFDGRSGDDEPPPPDLEVSPPPLPDAEETRRWLPSELRYDTVDVDDFSATVVLDEGELHLKNHRVRAQSVPGTDAVDVEARGGAITTPLEWLPEMRVEEVKARYQDGAAFLTSARFQVFETGMLDAAGEWDESTGTYAFQGSASGIDCADLLDDDWSRRLTGRVWLDYAVRDFGDGPRAQGTVEVREGVLTALPLLDSLSAYADTQRFRTLTLHESRADWEWAGGRFVLRNLRFTSEGLVRIQGTLAIGREGELDGSFRLGLAPGTLSRIPGAETEVFQPGDYGLLWTSLRITGTLDKPREDLTDRLIAAAGIRMFEILPETGERVLRHTRTLLDELSPSAVERALDVIGRGKDAGSGAGKILREAGGLLEGVLRGTGRDRSSDEGDGVDGP